MDSDMKPLVKPCIDTLETLEEDDNLGKEREKHNDDDLEEELNELLYPPLEQHLWKLITDEEMTFWSDDDLEEERDQFQRSTYTEGRKAYSLEGGIHESQSSDLKNDNGHDLYSYKRLSPKFYPKVYPKCRLPTTRGNSGRSSDNPSKSIDDYETRSQTVIGRLRSKKGKWNRDDDLEEERDEFQRSTNTEGTIASSLGGIHESQSSNLKNDNGHDLYPKETYAKGRHPIGYNDGYPKRSSDNPSSSSGDDETLKQTGIGRQRSKKGKGNRGGISDDSDSFSMTEKNDDMMQRLELYKKSRQRHSTSESSIQPACDYGGTPYVYFYDQLDGSDTSTDRVKKWKYRQEKKKEKSQWTIDTTAWNTCIGSRNTDMIVDLLRKKKLPDNGLLIDAIKVFKLEYIRLICDEICKYVAHKSKHIIYVYPATKIDETTKKQDAFNITFVVGLSKDEGLGNEFNFYKKNINSPPSDENENAKIRIREKETCGLEKVNGPERKDMVIKCIQKHSKTLQQEHTNLCRISNSRFKSISFGTADCCLKQIPCITLYVYAKGLIPLGENLLPTTLDFEDYQVPVDVRDGFVEVYMGPCDTFENLRMGCSIGVEPRKNEKPVRGTLGGFFEIGGTDFCISSAHVLLTANEMELIREMETPILDRNDCAKPVYQPHDNYHIPFGKGRIAIYTEGGNGQTGVEVISIQIENRNPISGKFPKSDGDQYADKEYCHGKVYNREEIRSALKTDTKRCFYKYGCGTGWTTGEFRTEGATFRAPHPVQDWNTNFEICLHNQFEIYNDTDDEFAGKSDSGALVFMDDNEELVAIGMVVAGMAGEVCFVTPLDEIFKALKLSQKNGLKHFRIVPANEDVDLNKLQLDLTNVQTEVKNIKGNMVKMEHDIKSEMYEMKNEMKSEINEVKRELNKVDAGMKDGFAALSNQLQNKQ